MKMQTNNKQFKKILELFGIFKDPIIGIDIGSSAVKIVELAKDHNDNYVIKNFAVERLNVGDVVEKNIKNKDAVISALNKALAKSKISSNLGCISVPNAVAISKIIQLEQGISDKEIANEIEIDADRYIPYELEDVDLDFEVIGPSKVGTHLMDILLVATKKDNIKLRLSMLEAVGINTRIVDLESLAIERVFNAFIAKNLPDHAKDKVVGLFDMGANTTSLNVFHNLNLVFNKENAFGGQQLLDEIQKRYGLTLQEAILARKYNDLPDDYNTDVLEPYRNKIAQQIFRLCQLFLSSSEFTKIDYVCLTGGTSNLPGIDDVVQDLLKIKVIIINPCAGIAVAENLSADLLAEESYGLMNCCGLALRNFAGKV